VTDVAALLDRLWPGEIAHVGPLPGGITNRNYLVDLTDGRQVVARVPGEHTELLGIDRTHEAAAARHAAALGVGPAVVGELPEIGTVVTEFVHGASPDSIDIVLPLVIAALRRFHTGGAIDGRFPIFEVVTAHARDAAAHGVTPPMQWHRLSEAAHRIEAAWTVDADPPVACHNDLLPANVLMDGDRVWLIDFEYAGMNDAFFDLANLSVNAALDEGAEHEMLEVAFDGVTACALAKLNLMKVMSELREGMWAVVQQAISTLDTIDFVAYAHERLDHCSELCSRPEFEHWLETVGARA
jgi:hypothetical protein